MARDSPATTIASHSPKKGGFQAAGRRSPDSSLPSKISTEACRSRWKAFLWRNGERGRKPPRPRQGEARTVPQSAAASPAVARKGTAQGQPPPVADCGWTDRRLYDEGTAACDIAGTQDVPVFRWQGMEKALSGESDKTKTSRSHAGDVLANSGARDGT